MSLEAEHEALKLLATQRCFYLFAALLLLLVAIPFLEDTPHGLVALNIISVLVLIAALAAVARSRMCFLIGALLAVPVVAFHVTAYVTVDPRYLVYSPPQERA